MAELTPEDYNTRNIYLFYDYEEAFMRYDYLLKRFYIKLINGGPEYELAHDTNLVCDIQRFGIEVTASDYNTGVPVLN
jgi:hypothetical protein